MTLKSFDIDVSLPKEERTYHLDNYFWELFKNSPINQSDLVAKVRGIKVPGGVQVIFNIQGGVVVTCDRSAESFDCPIQISKQVSFEFGDRDEEVDVDKYIINRDTDTLNIAQHLYEFVILAIPMKKIHPKYTSTGEHGSSKDSYTNHNIVESLS